MKKMWALVPLMAGIAATPAYAQQAGISGRAEVRVGYDEVRAEVQVDEDAETDDFGVGDIGYGAEIGVDSYVTSGFLVGGYAGVDFSRVDGCEDDLFALGRVACIDAGRNLSIGVRAGIPTGDGGLIYVKGGWSNAKFGGSYRLTEDGADVFSGNDTVDGYHLGAGFEVGLGRTVYLKGEYVHHRYKHAFADAIGEMDQVDPSRHQLMAGLGMRFGGAVAPPPPLPVAPPPPPPPPAAQAPATQTCPDGSVVLATQACPVPPPPPPPPPMPGERG